MMNASILLMKISKKYQLFRGIILLLLFLHVISFQPRSQSIYHKTSIASSSIHGTGNWDLELISPCKINLFLRILGRRTSGYHDLASLFQAVGLNDGMKFSKLPHGSLNDELICSDGSLAVDKSNLVLKALDLMRLKTGIKEYFRIYLDKRVPIQAGLGGGSGNAATAMYAFNSLCNNPASLEQMRLWSGDIGSDITFFLSTGTAYCTGRGEIVSSMEPLHNSEDVDVHIYKPVQGLSTASVFRNLDLENCSPKDPKTILDMFSKEGPVSAAQKGYLINDLESPAFKCEPLLQSIKKTIEASYPTDGLAGVMMSGSGTSIYALWRKNLVFDDKISENIRRMYPGIQVYKTCFINKDEDVRRWYN